MIINSVPFSVLNFGKSPCKNESETPIMSLGKDDCPYLTSESVKAEQFKGEIEFEKKADKLFNDFIQKDGRLKKEEYEALECKSLLLKRARAKIEEESEVCESFMPETAARCTMAIKDYLDLKYPEGYRIISVGTSPDSVSSGLEFLGCDVVYVPVSSLKNISKKLWTGGTIQGIENYPNLQKVLKYLEFKGITKKETENDPRKIIVLDVCHKGRTLNRFAKLLEGSLNISPDKIEKIDFIEILKNLEDSPDESERNLFDKYNIKPEELMAYRLGESEGYIGRLSNTPHFDVFRDERNEASNSVIASNKSDEELFLEFEKHSNPLARAHNLLLMNEIEKLRH